MLSNLFSVFNNVVVLMSSWDLFYYLVASAVVFGVVNLLGFLFTLREG